MPVSDPQHPPLSPSTLNELFDVMADESRRRVLYYLRNHGGTADVEELREHLSKRTTRDPGEIRLKLYHRILPKLDDLEVIDYDQNSKRIRYDGGQPTTELLEWIEAKERKHI